MPSLISGYEYDIFISYRQKDNKSRWVSDFVAALKAELEAVIKDDVSVYFDENAHDGLLDTHDVDESLRHKLQCAIFVPILSQTYCDPKSFAWKNEFIPFLQGNADRLKVSLANGNVASRILPVRIHELDPQDRATIEKEIGPIRSVDFVFTAPGINRPLNSMDTPAKNQSGTDYRDQINKVANAIKDIVTALQTPDLPENLLNRKAYAPAAVKRNRVPIAIGLLLVVGFAFFLASKMKKVPTTAPKPRVAVMPFKLIGDKEGEYFSAGMKAALVKDLQSVESMSVPPSLTETERFLNSTLTLSAIADELDADYIVDGSTQKWGDSIQLQVRLIEPRKDEVVWKETFRKPFTEVFAIQASTAKQIVEALRVTISPEAAQKLSLRPTNNIEAYDLFLQARQATVPWDKYRDRAALDKSAELCKRSIAADPQFADAYAGLAWLMVLAHTGSVDQKLQDSAKWLLDKSLALNPKLASALNLKSQMLFLVKKDTLGAMTTIEEAIAADPYDVRSIMWLAWMHHYWSGPEDAIKGLQGYIQAYNVDPHSEDRGWVLWNIALFFQYVGDYTRAMKYATAGENADPEHFQFLEKIPRLYLEAHQPAQLQEAANRIAPRGAKTGKKEYEHLHLYWRALANLYEGNFAQGLEIMETYRSKGEIPKSQELDLAILLMKNGKNAEAEKICRAFIKAVEPEGEITLASLTTSNTSDLARAFAMLGEKEKALEYIGQIKFHPTHLGLQEYLAVDPALENLRENDRFKSIIMTERDKVKEIRERVDYLEKEGLLKLPDPSQ